MHANSNEWTEGGNLEPDTVHKMAYLDAVRDVFGGPTPEASDWRDGRIISTLVHGSGKNRLCIGAETSREV
jgi:hypothetical protein